MLGTLPGAKRPHAQRPRHDGVARRANDRSQALLSQAMLPAYSPVVVSLSAGYGRIKSMPHAGSVSPSL